MACWEIYDQLAGHSVHHIEDKGKARLKGALLGQNARAKKYFAAVAARLALVKRAPVTAGQPLPGQGRAVFAGDLNVDWFAEKRLAPSVRTPWFPYTALGKVATVIAPTHGTHGGRAIDWVATAGGIKVHDQRVLPRGTSDHNPVLTIVELVQEAA